MKIVKTLCDMCGDHCGINVYVENEKIVKVTGMQEHPLHIGCSKAKLIPELVYSEERLTSPLRKVNGEFREISWDEAFELISTKLTDIKHKYEAKSVVAHVGRALVNTHAGNILRRLTDLYGTPNYTSGESLCYLAGVIGSNLTYGASAYRDFSADNRCVVVWGGNPVESGPSDADSIYVVQKRGSKLIVIDPRATQLAKDADIYAQIRPGTDCALALAMLNVIIAEELYDKNFVTQWTVGFDKLREHVKGYKPEKVEEITWVPADKIRSMARMYATNRPASILTKSVSPMHCTNGIQTIRAIATLIAITGNLDVAGGNTYTPSLVQANLTVPERVTDIVASSDYPLFDKYASGTTVIPMIDGILTGKPYPMKALLVVGCNPMLTWPNVNKVRWVLDKLELVVVVDIFMTDTAKVADIVLPGTTFMERQDLRLYPFHGFIVRTNRAIEPVGNSMVDWKIWAELGRRMGYAEYFPWKETDELFEYLLKPTNISLDQLKQHPGGTYFAEKEYQKYLENGFNTPSKKVEIFSQTLGELGYDPLPTFHEPIESPVSRPDLVEKYPLILITGARIKAYVHSEYRNLPSLRRSAPEPLMEINPQTASYLGIANGNLVKIESLRGSIKMKASLTEDIHPKVVSILHGWGEANANLLTDDEARDPISAFPGFRSVMCRVAKAD